MCVVSFTLQVGMKPPSRLILAPKEVMRKQLLHSRMCWRKWLQSGSLPPNNGFSGCGGVSNGSSLTFPVAQHNSADSLLNFNALQYRHIVVIGPIPQFTVGSYWNAKRLYYANDLRVLTRCLNRAFSFIIFCLSSLKFARRPLGILD